MRIGPKIRQIREDRKYSQSDMADLLGMSQSTYSRMERDETSVVWEDLVRYAHTLNVPVQEFVPDSINIQNVNDHGHGGPNLIMGDYHYHNSGDPETHSLMIELLKKLLDKI